MDSQQPALTTRKPIIYQVGFLTPRDRNKNLFALIQRREDYPIEMRNHFIHAGEGKSYSTMTYEDMADDVIAFADSLGFKTFDLCGYCFGGRIAVVTAAKYPDRVSSLQIIETSFGRFQFQRLDRIMVQLEHIYLSKMTQADTLEYIKQFEETPAVFQPINFLIDKTKPLEEVTQWRVNYDRISAAYENDLIPLPNTYEYRGQVQIIVAELTQMAYDVEDYIKVFPNLDREKNITIIKNEGHLVGLENPKVLAEAMEKFYEMLDSQQ